MLNYAIQLAKHVIALPHFLTSAGVEKVGVWL